jgi:hypothetical protein
MKQVLTLARVVSLSRHKREWEDLGAVDPLWAILSDNQKKFGRWDLEEFFQTGAN